MKKYLPLLTAFLFINLSLATTFHTISIDGTNDFAGDETFATTSGGYTAYITWDASTLYLGYDGNDVGSGSSSTKWVLFYFDTDPQMTPTSGTGTTTGQQYNTQQPGLPFSANYHLRWKTDNSYTNMGNWNGSAWDYGSGSGYWTGSANNTGNYVEISVPLSDLGNPSQIYITSFMINEQDGGEWTYAGNPSDAFSDGYDPDVAHYYGFNLNSGVAPNAAGNKDVSLPVELTSFTAKSGDAKVELHWQTASELNNMGYVILRSNEEQGQYEEIDSYVNNDVLKGEGTTSRASDYTYVDKYLVNGMTYYYKLADVDINGIRTEHGPIKATPHAEDMKIISSQLPEKFEMLQNYPNPFNPETNIAFNIPALQEGAIAVDLSVYNLLGEKVKSLYSGKIASGAYLIKWNGTNQLGHKLPSGVYIYQLNSALYSVSRKMILAR